MITGLATSLMCLKGQPGSFGAGGVRQEGGVLAGLHVGDSLGRCGGGPTGPAYTRVWWLATRFLLTRATPHRDPRVGASALLFAAMMHTVSCQGAGHSSSRLIMPDPSLFCP